MTPPINMVDHANSGLDHRVYEDDSRSEFTGMKAIKEIKRKYLLFSFIPFIPINKLCGA